MLKSPKYPREGVSGSCNEGGGAGGTDTHEKRCSVPNLQTQTTLRGCFPAIQLSLECHRNWTAANKHDCGPDNPPFRFRLGSRASLQLGPRKVGVRGAVTRREVRELSLPEAFNLTVCYSENDESCYEGEVDQTRIVHAHNVPRTCRPLLPLPRAFDTFFSAGSGASHFKSRCGVDRLKGNSWRVGHLGVRKVPNNSKLAHPPPDIIFQAQIVPSVFFFSNVRNRKWCLSHYQCRLTIDNRRIW